VPPPPAPPEPPPPLPNPQPATGRQPAALPVYEPQGAGQPPSFPPPGPASPPKKKGKGGKIALLIVGIVLLLAIAAAAIWYFMFTVKSHEVAFNGPDDVDGTYVMVVDTSGTATITTEPASPLFDAVDLTSSSSKVIKVTATDSGFKLEAKDTGQATLTAKSKIKGVEQTYKFKVIRPVEVIGGLPTAEDVVVGDDLALEPTILPEDATEPVTWASSDDAVATVDDDGLVSVVGAGTATITATSGDVTASVKVTGIILVEDIDVPDEVTVTYGEPFQLEASVLPADATDQALTFTGSDSEIAEVSPEGLITALFTNTASQHLYVTINAADGVSKNVEVTIENPYTWDYQTGEGEGIGDTNWRSVPMVFDNTVKGCTSITVFYTITQVTPSSVQDTLYNTDFALWGYTAAGAWTKLGTFNQGGTMVAVKTVEFTATDLAKVAVVPDGTVAGLESWRSWADIEGVTAQ
jgi:uncharacterized protein YjdB